MNADDYAKLSDDLITYANGIQIAKRPGYTQGNIDVLRNFKHVADGIPVDAANAEVVWIIYAQKHWDAIVSIMARPDLPVSEDPKGRFADLINYLQLGYALLKERG